jgi:hypothetical protein
MVILAIGWLQGQWIGNRPLFLVGIFFLLSGLQFIFFGLLAELLIFVSGRREECGIAEEIHRAAGNYPGAGVDGLSNGHTTALLPEDTSAFRSPPAQA